MSAHTISLKELKDYAALNSNSANQEISKPTKDNLVRHLGEANESAQNKGVADSGVRNSQV